MGVTVDWIALPEPRELTGAEQAVLDHLVSQADCPELTAQAASVRATATCDCGCSSLLLRCDPTAPVLAPETMARLSTTGREDWFSIDFTRWAPPLQVVVHVTMGSLHELEIFAGEGTAVPIPSPAELDPVTLH